MQLSEESKTLIEKYSHITKDQTYQKLSEIKRHGFTTTYDHSIRVALLSEKLSKLFGADREKVIRASLLHDFCLLDYHKKLTGEWYVFRHPKEAAINSECFGIENDEKQAIESHMFPLGKIPTNKIGWCLTLSDKIVAIYEGFGWIYEIPYCVAFFKRKLAAA